MRTELFILATQQQINSCNREFPKVKFTKVRLPCLSLRANKYGVAWFYLFNVLGDIQRDKTECLLNPNAPSKRDYILQTSSLKGSGMTVEGRPCSFRYCSPVSAGEAIMKDPISWKIIKIIKNISETHKREFAWVKVA